MGLLVPLLALALGIASAAPIDPASPPIRDAYTDPFGLVLSAAKEAYLEGREQDAMEMLRQLKERLEYENPDPDLAAEALIYLGEIHQNQGHYEVTEGIFRTVLRKNLDYPINPYEHPTEVVDKFEKIRQEILAELAARPPVEIPPLPPWGYAPFGVPQFAQRQTGKGLAYLGAQGALGALSVGVGLSLTRLNGPPWRPRAWSEEDYPAIQRRVELQRWLVQIPSTVAFYGVWGVSAADARRSWHKRHRERAEPPPPP